MNDIRCGQIDKMRRLRSRLRDPEWRRYGYLLLAGKALGVASLLALVFLISNIFGSEVRAADPVISAMKAAAESR